MYAERQREEIGEKIEGGERARRKGGRRGGWEEVGRED